MDYYFCFSFYILRAARIHTIHRVVPCVDVLMQRGRVDNAPLVGIQGHGFGQHRYTQAFGELLAALP
jgi:hypothetical protein